MSILAYVNFFFFIEEKHTAHISMAKALESSIGLQMKENNNSHEDFWYAWYHFGLGQKPGSNKKKKKKKNK